MPPKKKSLRVKPEKEIGVTDIYCRICMTIQPLGEFYRSSDPLDGNGRMSFCKTCISNIYVKHYFFDRNLESAIYKTCRAINLRYDESVISATRKHLETKGKTEDDATTFGIYKSRLGTTEGKLGNSGNIVGDMTFNEPTERIIQDIPDNAFDGVQSVKEFWGDGYNVEEYKFLEKELAGWKSSYACTNKAEEFYLKQICLKMLELERSDGKTDTILKSITTLMKDSALTPAQQTASSSGRGIDTWGVYIKMIEETTPAEFYKDKKLFKDFDNIGGYLRKYLTRPLSNFVQNARDFNISDEYDDSEDSDYYKDDVVIDEVVIDEVDSNNDQEKISSVQE